MLKLGFIKEATIARKILLSFLVISLVPVIFVGYITFKTSEKEIKQETLENLMAIAESNEASLHEYITEKNSDARELAFTPTIAEISKKYHDAFHHGVNTAEYKTLERKHRKYFIAYINEFEYHDIMFVDIDGNVSFTLNNEDYLASNLSDGPYRDTGIAKAFRKTIKSGKTVMSNLANYYPSYKPAAFISTPVILEGNIIGVVILQLSNEGIYATVQKYIGLGQTGEIVIASKKGNEAVFIAPLRHDPEAAFKRKVVLGSKEALPIQKAVMGESGSGISIDYRDKEILAVWRYLPDLEWGLVAKIDTDEAYRHIYRLRNWTFFIGLTTVILVILTALRISRSISEPIKALCKGSEIIGSGNLNYKIGTASKDEIGELSRRFDQMTENLKMVTASGDELNKEIAERKQAEENLEKYKILFSEINDLAYICDNKGNILFVNDVFEKMTNHKPEEFIGKSFAPLFDDESLTTAMDGYTRTLNGESLQFEVAFKDTGIICEYRDMPLRDEKGNIIGVMGIARDITERKKIEEAIQKAKDEMEIRVKERTIELESTVNNLHTEISERKKAELELQKEKEKLQKYLDISAVMVVMLDADQKVTLINKKGCDILGCMAEEVIGKNWFDNFLPEKVRDEVKIVFNKLMAGEIEPVEYYENEVLTKNGEERLIAWYNTVFRDETGKVINTLEAGVDITESRNAEMQIKASLKEKEVLLQEIHHRVKNNLAVISSLLKLQADKVKDKHYREMFDDSMNRIKTMALIHEKLYRTEDLAKVNFGDYIRDMIDNMYFSYGLNSGKVRLKKDIGTVTLGIDTAIPCGLIVNELLSNSLKYAFPEGRAGEIKVSLSKNDKAEVELTISDSGIGLPAGLNFKNTDSLGLNLVNALVLQLQGKIELRREQGTEFQIMFRRRE